MKVDTKQKNMKSAAIENIFVWMMIFVGFTSLFFFVINYATILRIQDNMNAISDYGANYIANNGTGTDISANINDISVSGIDNVTSANLVCNESTNVPPDYQVSFTTESSNNSYKFYGSKLSATRVVYNQLSGNTIDCTLTVNLLD